MMHDRTTSSRSARALRDPGGMKKRRPSSPPGRQSPRRRRWRSGEEPAVERPCEPAAVEVGAAADIEQARLGGLGPLLVLGADGAGMDELPAHLPVSRAWNMPGDVGQIRKSGKTCIRASLVAATSVPVGGGRPVVFIDNVSLGNGVEVTHGACFITPRRLSNATNRCPSSCCSCNFSCSCRLLISARSFLRTPSASACLVRSSSMSARLLAARPSVLCERWWSPYMASALIFASV